MTTCFGLKNFVKNVASARENVLQVQFYPSLSSLMVSIQRGLCMTNALKDLQTMAAVFASRNVHLQRAIMRQ